MGTRIDLLVQMTQDEFDGTSFNGLSLAKTLEKLTFDQIASKETFEKYSVWDITLHLAYWCYYLTRKITAGGNIREFPYEEKDWPTPPADGTEDEWRRTMSNLKSFHTDYIEALAMFPEGKLDEELTDWKCTYQQALSWMATHDLYHAAQIRNMGVPEV